MVAKKNRKKMTETRQSIETLEAQAPHLQRQINEYTSTLLPILTNRVKDKDLVAFGVSWAKSFIEWKALSRLTRSEEVQDPRVDQARELAQEFHGITNHHFFVTCIDGRNLPVIMFSFVPKLGGVMRTQAGELFSFGEELSSAEQVAIDVNSFEAQSIAKLLSDPKRKDHTLYYSLDSHVGCAARGGMYESEGGELPDEGLLDDVKRKMKIAKGITEFGDQLKKEGIAVADIIPQNFSYDPHDGTLYLGLEMHVDDYADKGFTEEVREKLRQNGDIISTRDFLSDPTIVKALEEQQIPQADFRARFAESMLNNWKATHALWQKGDGFVYKAIYDRVETAYSKNGFEIKDGSVGGDSIYEGGKSISRGAIENKAKIMLKNLVTRWSIAENGHDWPFAKHVEQAVVITEGGYGPFPNPGNKPFNPDAFAVFAGDDPHNLVDHALLSAKLVRRFRREKMIVDPFSLFEGEAFVGKPVLVMNHQIMRHLSESTWQVLEQINFSELFAKNLNWDLGSETYKWQTNTIKEHMKDLLMKVIGDKSFVNQETSDLIDAASELFNRTRALISHREIHQLVRKGRLIIVNKLIDSYRKPRVLMPMVF